jgi:hypothetical protein
MMRVILILMMMMMQQSLLLSSGPPASAAGVLLLKQCFLLSSGPPALPAAVLLLLQHAAPAVTQLRPTILQLMPQLLMMTVTVVWSSSSQGASSSSSRSDQRLCLSSSRHLANRGVAAPLQGRVRPLPLLLLLRPLARCAQQATVPAWVCKRGPAVAAAAVVQQLQVTQG